MLGRWLLLLYGIRDERVQCPTCGHVTWLKHEPPPTPSTDLRLVELPDP